MQLKNRGLKKHQIEHGWKVFSIKLQFHNRFLKIFNDILSIMLIAISANFILVSKEIFHLDSKGFNRAPHIKFHINENVWEINEKLYDIQFVCLL